MKSTVLVTVLAFVLTFTCATDIQTTDPFVGQLYVSSIGQPRGLLLDSFGDILVLGRSESKIFAIRETDHGNGSSTVRTTTIVDGRDLRLNHGIAFNNGYLYASSNNIVYRWPYEPGQFRSVDGNTVETVISGMDSSGHHITRTMVFDSYGRLYVSIGSDDNVDQDSRRARIRIFSLQSLPIPFGSGEVFADGVRNTVGLAFDSNEVLFGVDNGPDLLNRPDLGGEIWPENPGEEMNKFTLAPGTHYGYPYCWTAYNLSGYESGAQFAWPMAVNDGVHTDEWCRNPNNNAPPIWSMPAHSAPLSIEFNKGSNNCGVNGSFPCDSTGDAFIAFRGAWHEGVTYGYKVSWYKFNKVEGLPTGEIVDVIFAPNTRHDCNTCLRPVNAIFNKAGHLIVTADATNEIFRVAYNTELPVITNVEGDISASIRPFLATILMFIVTVSILINL